MGILNPEAAGRSRWPSFTSTALNVGAEGLATEAVADLSSWFSATRTKRKSSASGRAKDVNTEAEGYG